MEKGPTTGADQRSWKARPLNAFVLRTLISLAPVVAAYLVARITAPALWSPTGVGGRVVYIGQIAVVGSVAALLADRLARRGTAHPFAQHDLGVPRPGAIAVRCRPADGTLRRLQRALDAERRRSAPISRRRRSSSSKWSSLSVGTSA
ncbi:MAG: hypothetical protein R2706_05535 [Acidimicrobiales bacterium]